VLSGFFQLVSSHEHRNAPFVVSSLLGDGRNMRGIAEAVVVHRHTVRADFTALGLTRFSDISDFDLDEKVAGQYLESHHALGTAALEARLMSLGYNIQRARLRLCKARLGIIHHKPLRFKRLKWYETRGPDGKGAHLACVWLTLNSHFVAIFDYTGTWSVDQNEALQLYRISSFAAVDGRSQLVVSLMRTATWMVRGSLRVPIFSFVFVVSMAGMSRNPLYWELTTGLSGGDHTNFYCNALKHMEMAPQCLAVDMTGFAAATLFSATVH
jgi:hypothetical protein